MMQIARVIIDVKATAINKPFDYLIPDEMQAILQKGMRVIVPFGPRKVIGFVVDLIEDSDVEQLKEVIDLVDVAPVLTEELLQVGKWLAHETMCFYITAYQAMLPQLLKATYEREIVK